MPTVRFASALGLSDSDYTDIPAFAKGSEDAGYDQFAMGEHLMNGANPTNTVMTVPALAAAGGATRRIRLLAGVAVIPLYHPVMLAKEFAILDQVTNGRLDFGIGIGGQRDTHVEFDAVGVPMTERGRRADEILELVKRLWTEERVTFEGRYYRCHEVTLSPHPVQKPYPPIWVAGRSEAAMRRAVKYGDGWYPFPIDAVEFKATKERVLEIAAEMDRDVSHFRWGLAVPVIIADTHDEAIAMAKANMFGITRGYFPPDPEGDESTIRRYAVVGTAKECIGQIEERVDAGAEYLGLSWITPDDRLNWKMMRDVGRSVIPYFRD